MLVSPSTCMTKTMMRRISWAVPVCILITLTGTDSFVTTSSLRSSPSTDPTRKSPCVIVESSAVTHHDEVVTTCPALGGHVYRLKDDPVLGCPVFAARQVPRDQAARGLQQPRQQQHPERPTQERLGLEALVPGAFVLQGAVSIQDCQSIIRSCEEDIKFDNPQGAARAVIHVLASDGAAKELNRIVSPHVDLNALFNLPPAAANENREDDDVRYTIGGVNKHWRIHRYDPKEDCEKVVPTVDVGVAPTTLSDDGSEVVWNATTVGQAICSRFTVLLFLNDDFTGGREAFVVPASKTEDTATELLASVKPQAGSILVYPQTTSENLAHAQDHWPLHAALPVTGGAQSKYVLRTDILVDTSHGLAPTEFGNPLFQFDALVRDAFLPRSPIVDQKVASQLASLYNPHMGVENAGPLLYSLVRFTKPRRIVEIGAGYTSLWLLQALKDNDLEMDRILKLQKQGKCRLLDYPWSIEDNVAQHAATKSSLLCIDNCLHQRETATGAAAVAANLGLDEYLEFIQGDAYDMDFEIESIDLLWCDFGVGSRMRDFARGAWQSIRPGGFLVCHSTLTNQGTRDWLEDVRARKEESRTGIPPDEIVELSLLEPTKRYQNSVTILQRRKGQTREVFEEPVYSLYA